MVWYKYQVHNVKDQPSMFFFIFVLFSVTKGKKSFYMLEQASLLGILLAWTRSLLSNVHGQVKFYQFLSQVFHTWVWDNDLLFYKY